MEKLTSYPFNDITIEDIKNISKNVPYDKSRIYCAYFEDEAFQRNRMVIRCTAYTNFLNVLIKMYNKQMVPYLAVKMNIPSLMEYLDKVIKTIDSEIDRIIENGSVPVMINILECLHLDINELRRPYEINYIIDLLLETKGYKKDFEKLVKCNPLKVNLNGTIKYLALVCKKALDDDSQTLKTKFRK